MVQVSAIKEFAGSVINREDLGLVQEGATVEVSENDAQYLERDGLVERIDDVQGKEVEMDPETTKDADEAKADEADATGDDQANEEGGE